MKQYISNVDKYFYNEEKLTCFIINDNKHGLYKYRSGNFNFTRKGKYNMDRRYSHWTHVNSSIYNSSSPIIFYYFL